MLYTVHTPLGPLLRRQRKMNLCESDLSMGIQGIQVSQGYTVRLFKKEKERKDKKKMKGRRDRITTR